MLYYKDIIWGDIFSTKGTFQKAKLNLCFSQPQDSGAPSSHHLMYFNYKRSRKSYMYFLVPSKLSRIFDSKQVERRGVWGNIVNLNFIFSWDPVFLRMIPPQFSLQWCFMGRAKERWFIGHSYNEWHVVGNFLCNARGIKHN